MTTRSLALSRLTGTGLWRGARRDSEPSRNVRDEKIRTCPTRGRERKKDGTLKRRAVRVFGLSRACVWIPAILIGQFH